MAKNASFNGIASGLFTAPQDKNGGSEEYHIDMKFKDLIAKGDWKSVVEILDTVSKQYESRGLHMEFSNSGVGGEKWNHNASPDAKMALAKQAVGAHNHNPATTGFSLDFYIVPQGKDRFDASVSKPTEMALAVPEGGAVRYFTGGGYGNNAQVLGKDGKELFTIGHGGTNNPLPKNFDVTPQFLASKNITPVGDPKAPAPTPSSAIAGKQNLPTEEEAKNSIEKKGAKNTYQDMMSNMFGGGNEQGGGGFLGFMLFALVAMASGQNLEGIQKHDTDEKRNAELERIDEQRRQGQSKLNNDIVLAKPATTPSVQSKQSNGIQISPDILPATPISQAQTIATNEPPASTPQIISSNRVSVNI